VLALSAAFSGGLFLSVGILHILPEASENFTDYFDDDKEHFPFAFFITVMSFALILYIEKIAVDHHHVHTEDNHNHAK
jgi:zinc transporter 1/2/3